MCATLVVVSMTVVLVAGLIGLVLGWFKMLDVSLKGRQARIASLILIGIVPLYVVLMSLCTLTGMYRKYGGDISIIIGGLLSILGTVGCAIAYGRNSNGYAEEPAEMMQVPIAQKANEPTVLESKEHEPQHREITEGEQQHANTDKYRTCPKCFKMVLLSETRICNRCGTSPETVESTIKTRICPKCGTHNLADAWYCANKSCGETLSVNTITELPQDLVQFMKPDDGVGQQEPSGRLQQETDYLTDAPVRQSSVYKTGEYPMRNKRTLWLVASCLVSAIVLAGMSLPWVDGIDFDRIDLALETVTGWNVLWLPITISLAVICSILLSFMGAGFSRVVGLVVLLCSSGTSLVLVAGLGMAIMQSPGKAFYGHFLILSPVPLAGFWVTLLGITGTILFGVIIAIKDILPKNRQTTTSD